MWTVKQRDVRKIVLEEEREPVPAENEVIVEVFASGICGSDMHRFTGAEENPWPDRTVGHEMGGVIAALGAGVDEAAYPVGARVAVNPAWFCNDCVYCRQGLDYLCEKNDLIRAMAERVAVPARNLVLLPPDFDLTYAPLIEPAAVAFHASRSVPDGNVLVIGLGTVGLFAVQTLQKGNRRVVAADISEYALDMGRRLGLRHVIDLRQPDAHERIRAAFDGEPVDTALDFVGSPQSLALAGETLKKQGSLHVVGAAGDRMTLDSRTAILKELRLQFFCIYSREDFAETARQFAAGEIDYRPLLSATFPLHEAEKAFQYKETVPSTKIVLLHHG